MNLLIISNGDLPIPTSQGGAVETLIQTIIDANEKEKQHEITIYTPCDNKSREMAKSYKKCKFEFINTNSFLFKVGRAIRFLINRLPNIYIGNQFIHNVSKKLKKQKDKNDKYDYVIIENSPQYALILKEYFKDNLILHLHNDFLNVNIDMAYKILHSYAKVFTLSNYIKKRVEQIDSKYKNVYTLYNGVEINKFDKDVDVTELRKDLNIEKDDFVFLFTGRIVKEKGVEELLLAYKNMPVDKNLKLLIVGNLNTDNIIKKKYIKNLFDIVKDIKNKVVFTGYIPYEELYKYYKIADVGIVPSIWEEPFALTVIEHLASGHPVIMTNSGGMSELAEKKSTVVIERDNMIQNLTNAMLEIRENRQNYLKQDLLKQANKFDSESYYKRFNELITKEKV